MFWVNSRCVSYCLDNIWGDVVEETPSHFWNFIEMLSFCFYIPLCISGPLITFKEYKTGVSYSKSIMYHIAFTYSSLLPLLGIFIYKMNWLKNEL